MMTAAARAGLLVSVAFLFTGCPSPEADPPPRDPDVPDRPVAEAPEEMPDTTGESLWSYLHQADYTRWRVWPATMPMYEGTEPHGALLTTYLNDRAYGALTADDGPLPSGSIIVKESYDADSTMVDITVMYATEGYNPEHHDWFWAKYDPEGTLDVAGRVEMCQECHRAAERGHLMTPHDRPPPDPADPDAR